jgi:hypothetical protein
MAAAHLLHLSAAHCLLHLQQCIWNTKLLLMTS